MVDKPVGVIGAAISEAAEAREKQEWEAIKVIGEHVADYLQGGPDLEAEDIELGRRAGVTDLEVIELRWKVARKKVRDREAAKLKVVEEEAHAASLKKPEVHAEVEPTPRIEPSKVEPKRGVEWQRGSGGKWFYRIGRGVWRISLGPPPKLIEAKPIEHEEKTADDVISELIEEVKSQPGVRMTAGLKTTSKAFQHSKNPVGIPASLENAMMAVAMLRLECRYDLFHDRVIVHNHDCGLKGDDDFDKVGLKVRQIVLKQYGFDPAINHILDALMLECLNHMFDPVRDYLDGLKWDRVKRLDNWLVTYCKAANTRLNRAIGRTVLIAGVRRVKEPGVKFDYIMVLEGPQGGGKSTMLRILAGEENFSDAEILGADGREQQEAVQGVWIYELAELEGLGRSDVTKVKLFASKTHDKARPAYGRSRVDRARRCVFVATTNDPTYLRDRTGNRRFWPVEVGVIDLVAVARDRDQLWAEAVVAEASGEPLVIPQVLWPDVEARQKAKMEDDPWENILFGELERWMLNGGAKIAGGLSKMSDKEGEPEWRVSSDWLLTDVLQIPKERQGNNHAKRLAAVMRDLEWQHPEVPIRIGKVVRRGFVKPWKK
jgi:hypothetical protein